MPRGPIIYGDPVEWGHPLNRGLLSWWTPLRGRGAGGTLFDIAGRNHGTLTNGPTWGPGRPGAEEFGAVILDGVNDYVTLPLSGTFTEATFAVALRRFVNTPPVSSETGWGVLNSADSDTHYPFTDGNIYDATLRFNRITVGAGLVTDRTKWHTVIVTTRPGAGGWVYYQNAQAVTSATGDASVTLLSTSTFGRSLPSSVYIAAEVGEIRVWGRALSASEVAGWNDQWQRGNPDIIRRLPTSRSFVGSGGGGSFNAAWAAGSNVIVGSAF